MVNLTLLQERINELKSEYIEADRLNLRGKAELLLVDLNYLERLFDLESNKEKDFNKLKDCT